jgi:hypothetical protein
MSPDDTRVRKDQPARLAPDDSIHGVPREPAVQFLDERQQEKRVPYPLQGEDKDRLSGTQTDGLFDLDGHDVYIIGI